jgi:ligand-binding sensor domain-containing protein/signal transduction histidine kinase
MIARFDPGRIRPCGLSLTTFVAWVLLVCIDGVVAAAADPTAFKFQHLTIDDGLSQGSVECILQDRRGFMWFCTSDGLNRYDGRSFKVYKHDHLDPASISNSFVRHGIEARDGSMWFATKFGLNQFDPVTETFQRFQHDPADSLSLSSDNVMRVLQDRSGRLWVGTWDGGLCELDRERGTFRRYGHELLDPTIARGNVINAIHQSNDGTLWVAALTGLFSLAPGTDVFRRHDFSEAGYRGERDNIVIYIHERNDVLWLGTYTGVVCYQPDEGTWRRIPLDPGDPMNVAANQVRCIMDAPGGDDVWATTATRGLAVIDPATETVALHQHDPLDPSTIAHNALWSMYRDNGGTVWVGTSGRGVDKLTPMATRFPHVMDMPGSRSVWSVCETRNGDLWVGTGSGLVARPAGGGEWKTFAHRAGDPSSIGDGDVYAILEDARGVLWFATATTGLSSLDHPAAAVRTGDARFTHRRHDPGNPASIAGDRLFSLLEDRDGRLWVGTVDEGVDVLDAGRTRFRHHRPDKNNPESIADNGVECILQDAAGDFWFGTLAGGLERLPVGRDRFEHYRHVADDAGTLSNNHVTSLLEDRHGNLWIGTADGLNRFAPDRTTLEKYFEASGLPNNYIYGLVSDDDGGIWLSTNRGLSRFDPAAKTFRNFTVRDGLQSDEFNAGAYHRGPSGTLYFGGHRGFNRFQPVGIRDNTQEPPIVLTSCQVLGEPVALEHAIYATPSLRLSHDDYVFSFEFASLDYWAPERNRYQYMMEGLDRDWIEAGTRNFASYTHIDPGRYVFRVRGSNSDGLWNLAGTSIDVTIVPPFWRRSWFLALCGCAVVAGVFGLHRYRVQRVLELERLRTRISYDLHDEIATNLSSIAMFSGVIEEGRVDDEKSARMLTRLRELAEESVTSIRDIIWTLNPTTETLHSLLIRYHDALIPVCRARNVNLKFDLPAAAGLPARNLQPETRQHLWLLLKEAANNAIKHAGCDNMRVDASYHDGRLEVSVADDGRGFETGRDAGGTGLRTMRMRAAQLKGTLEVVSAPGRGTTVRVRVRV